MYVVVDRFRKMCIITPFNKKIRFEQACHIVFKNIWVHFGLATSIVSDQGFWFVGILGQICGTWCTQSWRRLEPFNHKYIDKPRWSIEQLFIFLEDIAANIPSCGMNSCITYNMHTIGQSILPQTHSHLRHVMGTFQDHH